MSEAARKPTGGDRGKGIVSAVVLFLCLLPFGLLAGGFVATRLLPMTGMGWDQLADALGGFMVGTLAAVVLGAVLVWRLGVKGRLIAAGLALIASGGMLFLLKTVPKNVAAPEPPPPPPPAFEPAFRIEVRTSPKDRVLQAAQPPIPWSSISVLSENRSLSYRTWGRDPDLCVAGFLPGEDAPLQAVAGAVGGLSPEVEHYYRKGTARFDLSWTFEGERAGVFVFADAFTAEPALADLLQALEAVVEGAEGSLHCEPVGDPDDFDPAELPEVQVEKEAGAPPIFRWSPQDAVELRVIEASYAADPDLGRAFWHIVAPPGESFSGPVLYGAPPPGAKEPTRAQPLKEGERYLVLVRRADPGAGAGFQPGRNDYETAAEFSP